MYQQTLNSKASFKGIALHSGNVVNVTVLPAKENKGITFKRVDLPLSPTIKAKASNVVSTSYATTIGKNNVTISTIEHLMAALYIVGVDNAIVEIDGPEVPILDGSAKPFIDALKEAGLKEQNKERRYLVITTPLSVTELSEDGSMSKKKSIIISPAQNKDYTVDYTIDFNHAFLKEQSVKMNLTENELTANASDARTFCFLKDVELLRANGLAKGGSLDNAIVIGDDKILNEDGLRYEDEFVRHKVIDLVGDLALIGARIVGDIVAEKSGHNLNHRLAKKIVNSSHKWKIVTASELENEGVKDDVYIENFAAV